MQERVVRVAGQAVAEYVGDAVRIAGRMGNHMRTYVIMPTEHGIKITVTVRGETREIPLPRRA